MMKFRVTDPSGSLNESCSTTSSTVNLTSRYLRPPSKARRNSLMVSETSRMNFHRRSSVPNEAFISIVDIANSSNAGIECVRYHRSASDVRDDEGQSQMIPAVGDRGDLRSNAAADYLGQTSTSFVFNNGKSIFARKSGSYDVNDIKEIEDQEISYRGFSHFDEIAINNDEESVLDSGLGSTNSLGSNYLKLRPLQTMSDLADIGVMHNWRSTFSWSNLRRGNSRKDIEEADSEAGGRYKWHHWMQLVLAFSVFSLGMRPIVDEKRHASGAFFVAHAVIMLGVGLPLSYLLSVIGQFCGRGSLEVWKMVPAAWGIGWAVLATMLINAVIIGVTVAYTLYYFIFVIQSSLPWEECNPDYIADVTCQDFCYAENDCYIGHESRPSYLFWRRFVLGQNNSSSEEEKGSSHFGYPKWDLLIALYVGWFFVALSTLKGMRILSRIVSASAALAIIFLIALILLHDDAFKWEPYKKMFTFHDIQALDLWTEAGHFSAQTICISIGALTSLSSYNPSHYNLAKMTSLMIVCNLLITWLSMLASSIYGASRINDYFVGSNDLIFDLFMDEMNAVARAAIFIVYLAVTKMSAMAILTDAIVSSMLDSLAFLSKWRLLTFVASCFTAVLLGLIFITPQYGLQIVQNTQYAIEASSILLLPSIVLTVVFGYGLHRLSDNVYIMTGSSLLGLSKLWLAAFLPGSLFPIMVSYFNHSNFYADYAMANLHVYGLVLFIVGTPFFYVIWIASRTACKNDSIKALFAANPSWPFETQSQPRFFHLRQRRTLHDQRRQSTAAKESTTAEMHEF